MMRRIGGFKLIRLLLGEAELWAGSDLPPTRFSLGNLHHNQGPRQQTANLDELCINES